jgi:hypothetical protein
MQMSSVHDEPSLVHTLPLGLFVQVLPQLFATLHTPHATAVQPLPVQQVPPHPSVAPQVLPVHTGTQLHVCVVSLHDCPALHGEPLPVQAPP